MAGFKAHITTSTVLGAGYGAAAHIGFDVPLDKCVLAAGLCSVSGMLPDLDSDSGVPVRELFALAAAIVPMLMIDRFEQLNLSHESMVLAGGLIYLLIRFGVAGIFKRYTVHRGMWHSIPAAATVGLLAFLICSCPDIHERIFKAGAVVLGFMSHLFLDELVSIQWTGWRFRLKRSFGTALKLWSNNMWANVSTYGKLVLLIAIAMGDPVLMNKLDQHAHEQPTEETEPAGPEAKTGWIRWLVPEDRLMR